MIVQFFIICAINTFVIGVASIMNIATFLIENPDFARAGGSLLWTWVAGIVAAILVIIAIALISEATKPGGKKHVTGAVITSVLAVIFCGLTGMMAYMYNKQLDKATSQPGGLKLGDGTGLGAVGRAMAEKGQ